MKNHYLCAIAAAILISLFSVSVQAEEYGDWLVECNEIEQEGETKKRCFMRQHLSIKDNNILVAQYAVGYFVATSEHPILNLTLPLGVKLIPGGALQLEDKDPVAFKYHHCDMNGCWGQFILGPQAIVDLIAAQKAAVLFVDAAGKPASLPIRLNGFAEALKAIQ